MPSRVTGRARVLVVVLVFLLVSAVASALLAVAQGGVGLDPGVLTLTQLASAVGALVVWLVWLVWRGRLPRPPVERTDHLRSACAVLLATLVLAGVLLVLRAVLSAPWPPLVPASLAAPLGLVLVAQLVGAAAEEVGWRGVVQPALETRMRLGWAGVVTGVLFGLGHAGLAGAGLAVFGLFLVAAVGLSLGLAVVTAGRGVVVRVVVATALHWLVNVTTLVGFSDGGDDALRWTAANVAAAGLAALAAWLVLRTRGRPGS